MGTNALPAVIEDGLSRGGMHSAAIVNDIELAQRGEVHLQRVRLQRGDFC